MGGLKQSLWLAVGGVSRGSDHARSGMECQDRTYVQKSNDVLSVALADGAGTAREAASGAETVTEAVCGLLCDQFETIYGNPETTETRRGILDFLLQRLNRTADTLQCSLRDLSSTLLAVAVSEGRFLALHIGDGVIGYTQAGRLLTLTEPQNGEFANTTYFVTSSNAQDKLRLLWADHPDIDGFVLMSDGTAEGLYDKRTGSLAPVLGRLIRRLSVTSEAYLGPVLQRNLDDVLSACTQDDCGMVLAARYDRSYVNLSQEELNAFFGIDAPDAEIAAKMRERYVAILNQLDTPRSEKSLSKTFGLAPSFFRRRGLAPLMGMGYVAREGPNRYRRTLEPYPGRTD